MDSSGLKLIQARYVSHWDEYPDRSPYGEGPGKVRLKALRANFVDPVSVYFGPLMSQKKEANKLIGLQTHHSPAQSSTNSGWARPTPAQ